MQPWPFDSEIHKAGSLNHFNVSATQKVVFQHNHPEKIEKKKSDTQKVKLNLSQIPAVLPSSK